MYKSRAQQRKLHAMASRGEISQAKVHEFDEATKGHFKELPEHVPHRAHGGVVEAASDTRHNRLLHMLRLKYKRMRSH